MYNTKHEKQQRGKFVMKPIIYLDMDGVLVDLDAEVYNRTGYKFGELTPKEMWKLLNDVAPDLFFTAKKMHDADDLVYKVMEYAKKFNYEVGILTALPMQKSFVNAKADKIKWLQKHYPQLLKNFKVGPFAKNKKDHAKIGDILIDDLEKNIIDWNNVGGIGVLHKSADETLKNIEGFIYRSIKSQGL